MVNFGLQQESKNYQSLFPQVSDQTSIQISRTRGFEYGLPAFRSPLRRTKIQWCRDLHFLETPKATVALASFPGSGNTWLRYLLQQATGWCFCLVNIEVYDLITAFREFLLYVYVDFNNISAINGSHIAV